MKKESGFGNAILRSDEPLTLAETDSLGRAQFSKGIAHSIANKQPPGKIVIGIYGKWGEGKTTIINFIEEELKNQDKNIVCIHFNPWNISNHQHLLLQFFTLVRTELGSAIDMKRVNEALDPYIKAIGSLAALNGIPGVGLILKSILKTFENSDIVAAKAKLNRLLIENGIHVVVFIDDIDRLDTEEVSVVFKLVKNVADFENTTYILAFDQVAVSSALNEKFPGGDSLGNSFIEKIIQVPLQIPSARIDDLWKMFTERLEVIYEDIKFEIPDKRSSEFIPQLYQLVSVFLDTPRQILRAINALSFGLPLLKGEVDVLDQTFIEIIRVSSPRLLKAIQEDRELFVELSASSHGADREKQRESAEKLIQKSTDGLTSRQKSVLKDVLEDLFPKIAEFHLGSGGKQERHNLKRVSAPEYFERYFTYSLSDKDISDSEFESFLSDLAQTDMVSEAQFQEFNRLLKSSEKRLISLLGYKAGDLNEKQSQILIMLLARVGGRLPSDDLFMGLFSTQAEASSLVLSLLKNISNSDKAQVLSQFLENCTNFRFMLNTYREIRRWQKKLEGDDVELMEEDFEQFESEVVQLVKNEADIGPLYKKYPLHAQSALYAWKTDSVDDVESYLVRELGKDPCGVVDLLKAFTPRSTSDGRNWKYSNFHFDAYERVKNIVSPDIVANAITVCFEGVSIPEKLEDCDDSLKEIKEEIEGRLVRQFLFIHNESTVKQEKEQDEQIE